MYQKQIKTQYIMKTTIFVLIGVEILFFFLWTWIRHRREIRRSSSAQHHEILPPFMDQETIDYVKEFVSKQPNESLNLLEFAVPICEGRYRAIAISLMPSSCKGDPKLIMCATGWRTFVHWGLLAEEEASAVMGAALKRINRLKQQ